VKTAVSQFLTVAAERGVSLQFGFDDRVSKVIYGRKEALRAVTTLLTDIGVYGAPIGSVFTVMVELASEACHIAEIVGEEGATSTHALKISFNLTVPKVHDVVPEEDSLSSSSSLSTRSSRRQQRGLGVVTRLVHLLNGKLTENGEDGATAILAPASRSVFIPYDPLASLKGSPALNMVVLNPTPTVAVVENSVSSISSSSNSNSSFGSPKKRRSSPAKAIDNANWSNINSSIINNSISSSNSSSGYLDKYLLIVDDCAVSLKLLPKVLQPRKYVIHTAKDGLEMVQLVLPDPLFGITGMYDIIIVDNAMPRMNGTEAVRYIREHSYTGVIIGLTAYTMDDELKEFQESGCNLVLQKPFDISKFDAFIASLSPTAPHAPLPELS